MNELPAIVSLALSSILGSSVIVALINWTQNRHKPKIERTQAEIAEMAESAQTAHELSDQILAQYRELKSERAEWREQEKKNTERLELIRREFDERSKALSVRVHQLETDQITDRTWMRRAYDLILRHVPGTEQIPPPSGWVPYHRDQWPEQ